MSIKSECINTLWYIHTMQYDLEMNVNELYLQTSKWMNLKNKTWSMIKKRHRKIHAFMIPFTKMLNG